MIPKKSRGVFVYMAIATGLVLIIYFVMSMFSGASQTAKYSDIMAYFDKYQVYDMEFNLSTGRLVIKVKDDNGTKKPEAIVYNVPNPTLFAVEVLGFQGGENYRQQYNEKSENKSAPLQLDIIQQKDNSWIANWVPMLVMIGGMVLLYFFMIRQTGGGKMNQFSKANVRNQPQSGRKTTFEDVAGAEEEKAELQEIVDFLRNPRKYNEIGARIPKGVLLLGPPGTGKTLLAKAVAGEANAPFFSISGSDFVEMFVGVGASRVRDLFEQAKKNAPSIIFIDEIDAVGRHRGAGLGGGHDEREQTLNQLLVEMDGFTGNEGIIIIAATNRRDILDPALLRPGRFDRQIVVGYPDVKGREAILRVHTRTKPLGPDVDLATIAKTTAGFTGADLENLVNEAAILTARRGQKAITRPVIEEAAIKVVAGPEKKSRVVTDQERRLTAYHEGGHALCTYYCTTQDKVHQISIIPRGMAGGFTMSLPEHDRSFRSKMEMEEQVIVLLGGRVAEKLVLDDISTGASNDIERATSLSRSMVTRYGFSEKLGPIVYGQDQGEIFLGRDISQSRNYSENVAAEIDSEIREIIESAYEKAKDILSDHLDQLHVIAKYLLKHEKIDGGDFEKLMKGELSEIEDEELAKEAVEVLGADAAQDTASSDQPTVSASDTNDPEK